MYISDYLYGGGGGLRQQSVSPSSLHTVSPWNPRHKEVIVRWAITSRMRCAKRANGLRESTIDTKRAHQTHLSWPLPLRRKHSSTQWNCIDRFSECFGICLVTESVSVFVCERKRAWEKKRKEHNAPWNGFDLWTLSGVMPISSERWH